MFVCFQRWVRIILDVKDISRVIWFANSRLFLSRRFWPSGAHGPKWLIYRGSLARFVLSASLRDTFPNGAKMSTRNLIRNTQRTGPNKTESNCVVRAGHLSFAHRVNGEPIDILFSFAQKLTCGQADDETGRDAD